MRSTPTIKSAFLLSQALCHHDALSSAFVLPSSLMTTSPSASLQSVNHHEYYTSSSSRTRSLVRIAASSAPTDGGEGSESAATTTTGDEISKAPTLNGKMVLPVKAMTAGLKGHKVAAVYAILNSNYKRGSGEGWEHVHHVDITRDLAADLSDFLASKGSNAVAHIRALSFSYPQKATMEDFASGWRGRVLEAGGTLGWPVVEEEATAVEGSTIITVGDDYQFDDDDDDDDDDMDHEDYLQMMAQSQSNAASSQPPPLFVDNTGLTDIVSLLPEPTAEEIAAQKAKEDDEDIVSPFETATNTAIAHLSEEVLEFTVDNVDKVLDEVRPYLISDGGNVSVQNVEEDTGNVYLLLEGACGSCASSTVTMKMGIERVLREKFGEALGEVLQVDPDAGEDGEGASDGLTMESVQAEVNRISQAIVAMGGVVRVLNVDPIGEVEIEYRGPNRVKKGLELALLDVEYVKHVKFVS
mmetsp:Transcript_28664/g.52318  ORF Transcript_28664/g.52318 Transcript_28664/m.52318 type:complete len:469 (-) Transcript_28664:208-1614(-)